MTDTLKDRAEKFALEHNWNTGVGGTHIRTLFVESLIAEIRWASQNKPMGMNPEDGWECALNHILDCLGEKNG